MPTSNPQLLSTVAASVTVFLFSSACLTGSSSAQVPEAPPRVQISNRAELVQALQGAAHLINDTPQLGLLAAQGPVLVPMLQAIVRDETENSYTRGGAISVLALMLDSSSVSLFVDIASHNGPLRDAALTALVFSPYPEACAFWRSILREPGARGTSAMAAMAIGALQFCGTEDDIQLIQMVLDRGVSESTRVGAAHVIAKLRRPRAERYEKTLLEGNYPPTGTYRPPPNIFTEIRARVCGGPCAPGLVLQASEVWRLRQ